MRAISAIGPVHSQLSKYPPEALESLCHTVRGDALDARRAAAPRARPRVAAGVARAWCGLAALLICVCLDK